MNPQRGPPLEMLGSKHYLGCCVLELQFLYMMGSHSGSFHSKPGLLSQLPQLSIRAALSAGLSQAPWVTSISEMRAEIPHLDLSHLCHPPRSTRGEQVLGLALELSLTAIPL